MSSRFPLLPVLALSLVLSPPLLAEVAAAPTEGSLPLHFTALTGADGTAARALFSARTRSGRCLWSTDGTPAGTFRLEIDGQCLPVRQHGEPVAAVADGVGFVLVGSLPLRVWRSDGTAAGTWPLTDFFDPGGWAFDGGFELLASSALGLVFFLADDGVHGVEPWVSDGSPGGARLLADVLDGQDPEHAFHFAEVGGAVLFFAPHGDEHELWQSDGTPEGTRPVAAIADGAADTVPGRLFPVDGGAVFFVAAEGGCTSELWRTDGTAAGTAPFAAFEIAGHETCDGDEVLAFAGRPGEVFFTAPPAGGVARTLWRTDGTAAGTFPLTAGETLVGWPEPSNRPAVLGGRLHFAAWDPAHGTELWRSDGTAGGAERLADLCPGPCSGQPRDLRVVGGRLVLSAFDDELGWEPWVSDGTAAGTRRVGDLCPGRCGSAPQDSLVLGDSLLFARSVPGEGHELASLRVPDGPLLRLSAADPAPLALGTVVAGRALFAADDGEHGLEPWVSDGTPQGTRMLVDVETAADVVLLPPLELTAEPLGGGRFRLHWRDEGDESEFGFTAVRQGTGEVVLTASAPADATSLLIELPQGTFLVRGFAFHPEAGRSEDGDDVVVQVGACTPGGRFLCLGGGRFRVSADWRVPGLFPGVPDHGPVMPIATAVGGDDSGAFWFFTPDNVELVVKVLDGGPVNGHAWVFWGGLSDVEYRLSVEDTAGGAARTYDNPAGRLCGGSDTAAFPLPGTGAATAAVGAGRAGRSPATLEPAPPFAAPVGPATRFVALAAPARSVAAAHPFHPCVPDERTLCLLDGTLAVTVEWSDQHNGGSGFGRAVPFTDLSGFFWFFRPDNVELVVKALDGRTVNGKIWVFYGALSDVGYTIRVLHDEAHQVRTYENPPGVICGRGDTAAF